MLLKLIKYDLKSTYAKVLLTFLIFIIVCIAAPLILVQFQRTAALIFVVFTGGLGCMAMYVLVFIFLFQRYNSNMFGTEGYLMFTLPTDGKRLLASKLVVAAIWFMLSYILLLCGLATMLYVFTFEPSFAHVFKELFGTFTLNADNVSCALVSGLIGTALFFIEVYLSITVSKLPIFGKCGVLMGFVTYFIVNLLHSLPCLLVNGIAASSKDFTMGFTAGLTVGMQGVKNLPGNEKVTIGNIVSWAYSWKYEWGNTLISVVFCALFFIVTTWLLNRKTSLK